MLKTLSNHFRKILLGSMVFLLMACAGEQPRKISVIVDELDKVASARSSQWAMGRLMQAMKDQGIRSAVYEQLEDAPKNKPVIVISGSGTNLARSILEAQSLEIPETAEALGLLEGVSGDRPVLLACGYDGRGLVYALLELADRMNYGATLSEALKVPEPIIEKPAVRVRSIYRTFTSDIEDKSWYNDREFWKEYLTELATQRVNRFSLSLGMG